MKRFEKVFFNLLSKESGFFMKDYHSKYSNSDKWIGILDLGEAIYAVIVTRDSEEDVNYNEANEFLSRAYNKPYSLKSIVLSSGDYIPTNRTSYENKIIFDLRDKKIVYCHESCKPLGQIIDHIVKLDTTPKEKISKYKATYILMGANILIYLVSAIMARNLFEIDIYTLVNMGAKFNPLINNGEVWRLITAAFLHGGLIHIGFNMMALKVIGPQVEQIYGWKKYLVIYFSAALGASLLSYILSPVTVSVGASGAIFGLLGAMLIFAFKKKSVIGKSFMMNIIQVIMLNVIIGMSVPNIDNLGHFGGLILGGLTAFILYKYVEK
ncbi:MAG: rhomboid family intramembrane serine protease [Terrisporobacter sp.]